MCDPVTLAIVASTAMQAYSQKQAGDAQAAIAKQNALVAGYQAKDALARGTEDVGRNQMKVAAIMGSQRVAGAANGVQLDTGTALAIAEDAARLGSLDSQTIMLNARREAWAYKVQAKSGLYQGQLDQNAGNSNALGSLLTGAGKAYGYQKGINGGAPQTFGGNYGPPAQGSP